MIYNIKLNDLINFDLKNMELPEDIITQYAFTQPLGTPDRQSPPKELIDYLIHDFNALTLKNYKESQKFLTKEEILTSLPNKIIGFYTISQPPKSVISSPRATAKSVKSWTDDEQQVEAFREFIHDAYQPSDKPDSKFKDVMTAFCSHKSFEYPCVWSMKYEELCQKLNIKYEKVVNPRFASSFGTCFLYLKGKTLKNRPLCYINEIPDLNV